MLSLTRLSSAAVVCAAAVTAAIAAPSSASVQPHGRTCKHVVDSQKFTTKPAWLPSSFFYPKNKKTHLPNLQAGPSEIYSENQHGSSTTNSIAVTLGDSFGIDDLISASSSLSDTVEYSSSSSTVIGSNMSVPANESGYVRDFVQGKQVTDVITSTASNCKIQTNTDVWFSPKKAKDAVHCSAVTDEIDPRPELTTKTNSGCHNEFN